MRISVSTFVRCHSDEEVVVISARSSLELSTVAR